MKFAQIDLRLRGAIPKEEAALLAAYEAATGRTVVGFDYERAGMLNRLANRDVSPEDIRTVVRYVRRLIRTGANKRKSGSFTPASLEFVNCLGDTAKFMDRLQTARIELASKRIQKGKLVAVEHSLGNGNTITRLDDAPARAEQPIRSALADALRDLAKTID